MLGLTAFHGLAAARGDGLRPELLELLTALEAREAMPGNVSEIADYRAEGHLQAGPNPVGDVDGSARGNVMPFPLPRKRGRSHLARAR